MRNILNQSVLYSYNALCDKCSKVSGVYRISLIIPALNEAANLPYLLSRIQNIKEIEEVILVDGGSNDGTIDVALRVMPNIKIIQQNGRGKGNATKCGANAAVGDYFMVLDADGSQRPEEIPLYIGKIREGYDLVKGTRYLRKWKSEDDSLDRAIMNKITTTVANILWRTNFSDLCYGVFIINKIKFLELNIRANYFELEAELMIKAKRNGLSIAEVPAHEIPRKHGKSNLTYRRDGWLIFKTVFIEWFMQYKKKH